MKWIYYSSLSGFSDPMEIGEDETGFDAADEFVYSEQGDYSFFVKKYEYEGKLYNQYELIISKQGSEIITATCNHFGDAIKRSQQFLNNINKINKTSTISPILIIKIPDTVCIEEAQEYMAYFEEKLDKTSWSVLSIYAKIKDFEFEVIGVDDIENIKEIIYEIKR